MIEPSYKCHLCKLIFQEILTTVGYDLVCTCSICLEENINSPKVFPCGHCCCKSCFSNLIVTGDEQDKLNIEFMQISQNMYGEYRKLIKKLENENTIILNYNNNLFEDFLIEQQKRKSMENKIKILETKLKHTQNLLKISETKKKQMEKSLRITLENSLKDEDRMQKIIEDKQKIYEITLRNKDHLLKLEEYNVNKLTDTMHKLIKISFEKENKLQDTYNKLTNEKNKVNRLEKILCYNNISLNTNNKLIKYILILEDTYKLINNYINILVNLIIYKMNTIEFSTCLTILFLGMFLLFF